jgi:hypothetical protein
MESVEPEVPMDDGGTSEPEVADSEPAVEENLPPEMVAEVETGSEDGFKVEADSAFEIEREPSFEEYGAAFGSAVETGTEDDGDPGFVSETTFEPDMEPEPVFESVEATFEPEMEPEPVFESVEATFETIEEAGEQPGEEIQGEAIGAVEEPAEGVAPEIADGTEDIMAGMEPDSALLEEATETVEDSLEGPSISAPVFGKRDPKEKAQRLARVLVSDIILYNPDRHHAAMETGRLEEEFEEEIQKSWSEYVEQVGEDVANNTPYFTDALNEILAKGDKIF